MQVYTWNLFHGRPHLYYADGEAHAQVIFVELGQSFRAGGGARNIVRLRCALMRKLLCNALLELFVTVLDIINTSSQGLEIADASCIPVRQENHTSRMLLPFRMRGYSP